MSGMCTSCGVLVFQGSLKCAITVLNLPLGGTSGSKSNKSPASNIESVTQIAYSGKCIANTLQHSEFTIQSMVFTFNTQKKQL